jgi:hypothetical protein
MAAGGITMPQILKLNQVTDYIESIKRDGQDAVILVTGGHIWAVRLPSMNPDHRLLPRN